MRSVNTAKKRSIKLNNFPYFSQGRPRENEGEGGEPCNVNPIARFFAGTGELEFNLEVTRRFRASVSRSRRRDSVHGL